jgi:predicted DNA-binding transcriptional regulator AlpA
MRIDSYFLETLLNEHDVARLTGLSVATIRRRRIKRLPPKWLKLGSAVKYKPSDIADWIGSQPTVGSQQAEPQ